MLTIQLITPGNTPQREKGSSLLKVIEEPEFVVIDIETTGTDPHFDEIIELGAIKYNKDGTEIGRFQSLIKPEHEIDEFISELTGITNEMLQGAPEIGDVIDTYVDFIGHNIIVGHNVNFDINFIYDNYLNVSGKIFNNNYLDTLRLARRLLPEAPNHKLETLVKYYSITTTGAHRSISDCISTAQLYFNLLEEAKKKNIDINELGKRHRDRVRFKASDIQADVNSIDEDNPLFGKTVVFTGALERMIRKDAMQLVVNIGGNVADNLNKKCNFLVIGNGDYSCVLKDGKSSKHKKAEELIKKGADLQIISEDAFFDMLSE